MPGPAGGDQVAQGSGGGGDEGEHAGPEVCPSRSESIRVDPSRSESDASRSESVRPNAHARVHKRSRALTNKHILFARIAHVHTHTRKHAGGARRTPFPRPGPNRKHSFNTILNTFIE